MAEYIEREALLDLKEEMWQDRCDHMVVRVTNIMNVPAADVAPVVHGRWDENGSGIIICSECGSGYNLVERYTHYCPNCGAKMDGATNGH